MKSILLVAVLLPIGCEAASNEEAAAPVPAFNEDRVAAIEAGARREHADDTNENDESAKPARKGEVRYVTNGFISVCPQANDWFKMQDAVVAGDNSVNLPLGCQQLSPGAIVIAPEKGQREVVSYNGHEYEKGRFEDGRVFWTDELDANVLSRA